MIVDLYLRVNIRHTLTLLAVEAHIYVRVTEVFSTNKGCVVGSFLVSSGSSHFNRLKHISFQTYQYKINLTYLEL